MSTVGKKCVSVATLWHTVRLFVFYMCGCEVCFLVYSPFIYFTVQMDNSEMKMNQLKNWIYYECTRSYREHVFAVCSCLYLFHVAQLHFCSHRTKNTAKRCYRFTAFLSTSKDLRHNKMSLGISLFVHIDLKFVFVHYFLVHSFNFFFESVLLIHRFAPPW